MLSPALLAIQCKKKGKGAMPGQDIAVRVGFHVLKSLCTFGITTSTVVSFST